MQILSISKLLYLELKSVESDPSADMKTEETSLTSSSTTTRSPSPLPVSTGPNNVTYSFSPSPLGFPFPLSRSLSAPSTFSVDWVKPGDDTKHRRSSCLQELVEWFWVRCCDFCWWNFSSSSSRLHRS